MAGIRPADSDDGGDAPSVSAATGSDRKDRVRTFDGIVCFGDSDWWYHNRGHYDMQMMRQFSRHLPVLYVNSIGLRMPRLGKGGMFLHRLARKFKSLRRGLVRVQENFSVFSPLVVPGKIGMLCSKRFLGLQVRWAMRRLGMRQPLVWVACPPAAIIVDTLRPAAVIYQRTDRYEEYPGADIERICRFDQSIKRRADLTLFCSSYLMAEERAQCRRAVFADHGVDFERFAAAGEQADARMSERKSDVAAPASSAPVAGLELLERIARPRAGFVGGIDAHTFDAELFNEVAGLLPEVNFVLVGGCSLPEGWCRAPNVTMLGQQPYEQVADYMASCDVLIMPWNKNDWIRACNPVKLKEYLAAGRPVVSSPFEELRRYEDVVLVAKDSREFAARIRDALKNPPPARALRRRVQRETWTAKAELVLGSLREEGFGLNGR